jgi:hypothetical protein
MLEPEGLRSCEIVANQQFSIREAQFPSGTRLEKSLVLGSNGISAVLLLRIDCTGPEIQTVLDFEHSSVTGACLQFRSEIGTSYGELCWFCAGISLTAKVCIGIWTEIHCGYDIPTRTTWLSVNGAPPMSELIPMDPFDKLLIILGIGCWVGGKGRELHGGIQNLHLSTDAHRTGPMATDKASLPSAWSKTVSFGTQADTPIVSFDPTAGQVPSEVVKHFAHFSEFSIREDVIGAAHYLNQIHDLDCRLRVSFTQSGRLLLMAIGESTDMAAHAKELLAIDMGLGGVARWALTAALASCAQTLYRRGNLDASRTFLAEHKNRYGQNHVLIDIALGQSRHSHEGSASGVLVSNLALGGLDYLDHFRGKHCTRPFNDMEIRSDGETFVCCPSLLPDSIGNIFKVNSIDEVKSSQKLLKIKDSIIRQDFRYCRWLHCTKIRDDQLEIRGPKSKVSYQPTNFRLSYDPTCNLWCPSCRTEKIVAKGAERERFMRLTDEIVLPMLKTASSCMMSGYGDVFASRACRKILETANAEEYPNLKFDFITNGVLFTREEWAKFTGIHDMVRSIRVSIDASCKKTYDQVRLGGDWGVLMQNLDFISELRRQNVIERFMISMVVQEGNFTEMSDFARMAKRLGCDCAIFEPIMDWNTSTDEVFQRKAVHYSTHPSHGMFQQELERIQDVIPCVPNIDMYKGGWDELYGGRTAAWINF